MFRRTAVLAAITLASFIALSANAQEKSEKKPAPGYKACPKNKVWNDAQNGCVCAPGFDWEMATRKCVAGASAPPPPPVAPPPPPAASPAPAPKAPSPPASTPAEGSCAPGKQWSDAHGACVVACPPGKVANAKGDACVAPASPAFATPAPSAAKTLGTEKKICGAGKEWSESKRTCIACAPGTTLDAAGATCVAVVAKNCPEGKEWKDAFGGCVPLCPADHVLDFNGSACHPIKIVRRPR